MESSLDFKYNGKVLGSFSKGSDTMCFVFVIDGFGFWVENEFKKGKGARREWWGGFWSSFSGCGDGLVEGGGSGEGELDMDKKLCFWFEINRYGFELKMVIVRIGRS